MTGARGNAHDAIIIGAGHNGLVTACYLARAGLRRCWCWSAATSSAAPASPRRSSPASRSPPPPTSTACFRPEIIRDLRLERLRLRDARRATRRRSRRSPTAARSLLGPDAELTRREIAKFSARDAEALSRVRGDAGARRRLHRADARCMTPPDLLRPGPRDLLAALASWAARSASWATDGARGGRDPDRRRRGPSSTAGSSRSSSRRRWPPTRSSAPSPRPSHARHRLRAVPPRHGRVQRRARRLGLRARRHGRAHAGAGRARPATWASRSAARRRWPASWSRDGRVDRRRAGRRRPSSPRPRRRQQRRRQRHLPASCSTRRSCPPTSSTAVARIDYDSASLKINVALTRAAELHRLPGSAARPAAPRHHPHLPRPGLHRARLRRRQVRPAVGATRCSNARCRRRSIRRSRRRAST